MRVMLATICLNEMEWLPKLIEQHRDWPGLVGWCFVEGADPIYRRTNPETVSEKGLSVDGTTEFLEEFVRNEKHIDHVSHIQCMNVPENGDQGKCYLRNQYLEWIEDDEPFHKKETPDVIVTIDCDEFYTRDHQRRINEICEQQLLPKDSGYTAIMFKQRHIWRPPHTQNVENAWDKIVNRFEQSDQFNVVCDGRLPLLSQEVVGGYWDTPHTRVWKYLPGMRHSKNHNWPDLDGVYLTKSMLRCDLMSQADMPQCVHLGFASSVESRRAKHSYYVARGEGKEGGRMGQKRRMYVECREAYERWRPGDELPHGARVIGYDGPVPEVFLR
ncbi:MAG: hypothetical protein E6R03_04685 [Hyphomicrobiaceae bacterium]|nr:MAG: hypothetical protein E6R03_04685 [Hyphomicrobiaceae bacterium]